VTPFFLYQQRYSLFAYLVVLEIAFFWVNFNSVKCIHLLDDCKQ